MFFHAARARPWTRCLRTTTSSYGESPNRSPGRFHDRPSPLGFTVEQVLRPARRVGLQPTCGTGIEPATASSINWCSTVELTRSPEFRSEPMSGTDAAQPFRVARLPLDGDINGAFLQRDAGGSRTHWMRLCRPPPRRVTSASSNQCPCQESNLVYDLRGVACVHHTPRTEICTRPRNRTPTCGFEDRRASGTLVERFLSVVRCPWSVAKNVSTTDHSPRTTDQLSTSMRIRTPSSGFGDHPLSQELARVLAKG